MNKAVLVCPECGRTSTALSHSYHVGKLTIFATCLSPLCGKTWKVYGVKVVERGVRSLPEGRIVSDG